MKNKEELVEELAEEYINSALPLGHKRCSSNLLQELQKVAFLAGYEANIRKLDELSSDAKIPAKWLEIEKKPPHRPGPYLCVFVRPRHDRLNKERPPQSPQEYNAAIQIGHWTAERMYEPSPDGGYYDIQPQYYMYLDQFIEDARLMQFEKDSAKEKNNVD